MNTKIPPQPSDEFRHLCQNHRIVHELLTLGYTPEMMVVAITGMLDSAVFALVNRPDSAAKTVDELMEPMLGALRRAHAQKETST